MDVNFKNGIRSADTIETLGDALPKEQARVREILSFYKETGSARHFVAIDIEKSLQNADKAAISGDVLLIMKAYEDLKNIK